MAKPIATKATASRRDLESSADIGQRWAHGPAHLVSTLHTTALKRTASGWTRQSSSAVLPYARSPNDRSTLRHTARAAAQQHSSSTDPSLATLLLRNDGSSACRRAPYARVALTTAGVLVHFAVVARPRRGSEPRFR